MSYAFFYDSINGDRVYNSTSFENWLKKFFTSGVFLNDLLVTANDDMTVNVGNGYVNADGKVKIFESNNVLKIETAGATYPRIDSVVLERNDTERDVLLKVVKGGYSSNPVAHVPVRENGVYQLVIAQILVEAGAVKITQANITDTRSNTEICGIVAGAVDQIDFSQIQMQFDAYMEQEQAEFDAWFNKIRGKLSEDAAGNLQEQINDIEASMSDVAIAVMKDSWTAKDDGTYYQEITVQGLLEQSAPMLMLASENDVTTDEEWEAFSCIYDSSVEANKLTLYATEIPSMSFVVIAKSVVTTEYNQTADLTELIAKINALEDEVGNVLCVDNLLSTSAELPLSANQGRVLDEKISEQNKKIGNIFSTEEVKTNDVWIDGKPLYRKVIEFGKLPNNTSKSVNHNIENIDVIMADTSHCFAWNSSGSYYPLPYVFSNSSSADNLIGFTVNKTVIKVTTPNDRSELNAYITLLYTKTTD